MTVYQVRQEKEKDFLWYEAFKFICFSPKGDNYENDENKVRLYFSARWPLITGPGTINQFCTPLMWPSYSFCLVSLSCLNKCDINDIKRNLIFKILWSYPDEDLNEGCFNHYCCLIEHYIEVFNLSWLLEYYFILWWKIFDFNLCIVLILIVITCCFLSYAMQKQSFLTGMNAKGQGNESVPVEDRIFAMVMTLKHVKGQSMILTNWTRSEHRASS